MNVQVYYIGKEKGYIPYETLPAFRLLCEEWGMETVWEDDKKKLYLQPSLTGKKVNLLQTDSMFPELMDRVYNFLSAAGVYCKLLQDKQVQPDLGDVYIQCSCSREVSFEIPQIIIFYDWSLKYQKITQYLQKELEDKRIQCFLRPRLESSSTNPFLDIQCFYPETAHPIQQKRYEESIAICIATSILRFFNENQKNIIFPFLLLDTSPLLLNNSSDKDEQQIQQEKQSFQGEVFFDYSVSHAPKENHPYLIIGSLSIKNTGSHDLQNPIILMRATPAGYVKLRGQILPPNLVESRSLQKNSGKKGWMFMDDDWLTRVQEQGEYWICPIGTLQIPPHEVETLNFQLSISKPENTNTVAIEGFVYFQDQTIQFPASNRLVFSF